MQAAVAFCQCRTLWAYIVVVEAVVGHTQNTEHIKGRIGFHLGQFHGVGREPRAIKRLAAKGVIPLPNKVVPIAHSKTQMLGHGFAHDHFVWVVVTEGQWVGAVWPFELDRGDGVKIVAHREGPCSGPSAGAGGMLSWK